MCDQSQLIQEWEMMQNRLDSHIKQQITDISNDYEIKEYEAYNLMKRNHFHYNITKEQLELMKANAYEDDDEGWTEVGKKDYFYEKQTKKQNKPKNPNNKEVYYGKVGLDKPEQEQIRERINNDIKYRNYNNYNNNYRNNNQRSYGTKQNYQPFTYVIKDPQIEHENQQKEKLHRFEMSPPSKEEQIQSTTPPKKDQQLHKIPHQHDQQLHQKEQIPQIDSHHSNDQPKPSLEQQLKQSPIINTIEKIVQQQQHQIQHEEKSHKPAVHISPQEQHIVHPPPHQTYLPQPNLSSIVPSPPHWDLSPQQIPHFSEYQQEQREGQPLLVQFLIYADSQTSQPLIFPLTQANLNQSYGYLMQLIYNNNGQIQ